jgi:hypothetical protein
MRRIPEGLVFLLAVLAFSALAVITQLGGEARHWRKLAENCSPIVSVDLTSRKE